MKYKIDWLEKKSDEWIIANLLDEQGGSLKEVSINKTSKKGEVFPDFDNLAPGHEINGEHWVSQAGKNYLFPPRPESNRKPNMDRIVEKKAGLIGEAQNRKAENIAEAQSRNEVMWAKYGACQLVANHPAYKDLDSYGVVRKISEMTESILNMDLNPF